MSATWAAVVLAILFAAVYLRFEGLGDPSLWYDEVLHFEKTERAANEPWHAWLFGLSVDRENGSLYYATQLLALRVFDGEFATRLMPALAGVVTVGIMFLVGLSATGSRRIAATTALLVAVSPLHVYYSREGRPYAAVMLTAALLLLLALESRRRWSTAVAYLLCIATSYWGAVAAPVLLSFAILAGIDGFFSRRRGHFVLAALSGLTIGLLLFPTVERLSPVKKLDLIQNPVEMEITLPISTAAMDRLVASLSVSGVDSGTSTSLSFVLLALAIWGAVSLARKDPSKALWVTGMCLLPIAGWLALLVALERWYNVRYTSAGLPAFLLLVAIGLVDLTDRLWQRVTHRSSSSSLSWVPRVLLVGLLMVLLAPTWRAARSEPRQKPDWRGVADLIGSLASLDEPVITNGWWSEKCIQHYLDRLALPLEVISANYDLATATRMTERHSRAWILAAGYLKAPGFRAWIHAFDPILRSRLANLELSFFPGFSSFLAAPNRLERLEPILTRSHESGTRQEFGHSELLLGAGWSYPERGQDGTIFRWASADITEVALLDPRVSQTRVLRLRLYPLPSPDQPSQTVEIAVNSQLLERISLDSGWKEYELSVPENLWSPGANLLTFEFGWLQSPSELDPGSPDSRRLAVAFDYVETVSAEAQVVPSGED